MNARAQAHRRGRIVADLMAAAVNDETPHSATACDVEEVTPYVVRSGAGPLAWWALRRSSLGREALPLQDSYRKEALRSAVAEHELAQLFRSFRAAGVDPVLGKGWAVSRHYAAEGLRTFCDFDVYVERSAHAAIERLLSSRPTGHAYEIDLHEWSYLDDRLPVEIRCRTREVALADTSVRVFGIEDQLRLACLHACAEGLIRPAWLCDVAVILARSRESFDWDYFATGSPRRTEWCFATIQLAGDLLRLDVSSVPGASGWKPLPQWFARSVLEAWGSEIRPRGSRTPFAAARRPGAMLAALLARWPQPIEATVGSGGRISSLPRLPYKVADGLIRLTRFMRRR